MTTTGDSVDVQKEEGLSQEWNYFFLDELQPRKDPEWPRFCSGGRGAQQSSGANICVQCSHHRDDPGHMPGSSSPDAGVWGFIPSCLRPGRHGSDPNKRQTPLRQSGHRRVRIRVSLKHVCQNSAEFSHKTVRTN